MVACAYKHRRFMSHVCYVYIYGIYKERDREREKERYTHRPSSLSSVQAIIIYSFVDKIVYEACSCMLCTHACIQYINLVSSNEIGNRV